MIDTATGVQIRNSVNTAYLKQLAYLLGIEPNYEDVNNEIRRLQSMWYERNGLDYSKPIKATKDGMVLLLLPFIREGSYEVIGYNWFNMTEGGWNSCAVWETPEQAVLAYKNYAISNADITIS